MKTLWKSAVLCSALTLSTLAFGQNATSGGDQQPQQDAQGQGMRRGTGGLGGQGGRRGGATRGTVASVSGSNIVVKDDAGTTWTIITTENTRVMRGRETLAISGIQPGDEVMSMGMPDADKHELHAMMVMDVPAADVAKAKANLGKTYIVGRITAIDETKLTIMRTDKVSQTISLDETTSLRKGGRMDPAALQAAGLNTGMMGMGGGMGPGGGGMGPGGGGMGQGGRNGGGNGANRPAPNAEGESITLADVKVGDSVIGLGSVKGGVFVPTDLRVQEQRAGGPPGGRRNGGNGDAPPPPPQQ
ncbi:DUF5666 domain-containing protein [Terriglobus sp. TAA 43]|uniref:DUF5666 domain-containing protein n=1 Tax=Terriglobus sp. TAA 43 TaxID=278961 RepID=UPI000ACC0396|nr:DUF5666 domain-containing protein [Terriglobus sp. TAA 43]